MKVPTLRGERVTLRPMTHADADCLVRWAADPDYAWFQWGRRPGRFPDAASARDWIDRFAGPAGAVFAIEHEGRPIGHASYRDLQPKAKSTEVGIGIGEKTLWSRGLGREALRLLVRHLQHDLGLHRITLHVLAFNDRAIASYKACGFQVESVERDAVITDRGHFVDDIGMALVNGQRPPAFDPRPVTLAGARVWLEPLRAEHAPELFAAATDPDIWTYLDAGPPRRVEDIARYIRFALDQQTIGAHLPFLVRRVDGTTVGTTRYAHIDRWNRTCEIGWTFYSREARRTAVNTECKLLLLAHAFEALGAIRVWLQTDSLNERSQRAIERLGATREGVLRNERILSDGRIRHSVIYGLTADDWAERVKARLEGFLAR